MSNLQAIFLVYFPSLGFPVRNFPFYGKHQLFVIIALFAERNLLKHWMMFKIRESYRLKFQWLVLCNGEAKIWHSEVVLSSAANNFLIYHPEIHLNKLFFQLLFKISVH